MATSRKGRSPPSKRLKLDYDVSTVAKKVSEIDFPWENAAPHYFTDWLNVFSRAHGTTKEIMIMALIPTVAGLLGSRSTLKLTNMYKEKINIMAICVAPPCSGKSAAINHGGKNPLLNVEKYNKVRLLVDNFTTAGLTEQIILNGGIAICIKDELYSDLKHIMSEKSMGYLCRWYDGDSFFTTKGINSAERIGVDETGFCLGGFVQVRNFMEELLPQLVSAEDGFFERILLAVVRPEALTRSEAELFASQLADQYSDVQNLTEIYDSIYRDHHFGDPVEYTLSTDAKKLFDEFDSELCKKLNEQWASGGLLTNTEEMSAGKDRKNTLRLSVVLHVLYFYIRRSIFKLYGPLPKVIGQDTVSCAIQLTKYFRAVMNTISKVMNPEETSKERLFSERVLRHKGSVVLLRNVRNKLSASSRPSIDEAVQTIEALKDKGLGDVVSTNKTKAFVKQIPDKVDDALLEEYGMDVREYTQLFLAKDMELKPQHKSYVLNLSEIGCNVSEFEQNQKENVDSSN